MTQDSDGVVRTPPLERPITKALGARNASALAKIGVGTIRDLLSHYPRRYSDPGRLTDLSDLTEGEHVVLVVDIASFTSRRTAKGGHMATVEVTDGVRRLPTVFFSQRGPGFIHYLERTLRVGQRVTVEGVIGTNNGRRQIIHPDIEGIDEGLSEEEIAERATRPKPVYPLTGSVKQKVLRAAVRSQLDGLTEVDLPDPVPYAVRLQQELLTHAEAVRLVHDPETSADWVAAQKALRFEEAFVLQTAMAQRRAVAAASPATARPRREGGIAAAFDARLPFTLTPGQVEVGETIAAELASEVPMQRLLQGEVGSGKTVVALRAMLQVVDAGGQAALLAPTEVLAAQHERSIRAMLGELGEAGMLGGADDATRVVLLTGSASAASRRKALAEAAGGSAGIVIGTHALIQEHVQFADLGLVVVDEQHRFGVEQRDALRAKGRTAPHLLVMTATPIPRTVAMTIFGDLETSTLRDVPAGRAAVETHVVPAANPAWLARTWARVAEEVHQGRRAYVVCPRISPSEKPEDDLLPPDPVANDAAGDGASRAPAPELASVTEVVERLRAEPALAGIPIGALHGRMAPEEKDAAMAAFSSGEVPVLVATTVVEVGVDVPTASVMVILDADRFGLSQLHQLRGRIGRGTLPGVCLPVTAAEPGTPAHERLGIFASTRDGFVLAEADLVARREGDVLGAAQSGRTTSLRLLRVVADAPVIERARTAAREVVAADPDLHEHPELAAAIARALDPEAEEFLERT